MFVFPSRTDTFGLVLLEALASGVPVAAFPAAAPRDVIGEAPVGVLDEDLRRACLEALECSPEDCRDFALGMTWEASARIFIEHVTEAAKAQRANWRREAKRGHAARLTRASMMSGSAAKALAKAAEPGYHWMPSPALTA